MGLRFWFCVPPHAPVKIWAKETKKKKRRRKKKAGRRGKVIAQINPLPSVSRGQEARADPEANYAW
jgi:hypothetical protein